VLPLLCVDVAIAKLPARCCHRISSDFSVTTLLLPPSAIASTFRHRLFDSPFTNAIPVLPLLTKKKKPDNHGDLMPRRRRLVLSPICETINQKADE
jgi:hypothetical protein